MPVDHLQSNEANDVIGLIGSESENGVAIGDSTTLCGWLREDGVFALFSGHILVHQCPEEPQDRSKTHRLLF